MNTQIFHLIKYDLKSHKRSHKVTFIFKNPILLDFRGAVREEN
jgi:hypothetical protein